MSTRHPPLRLRDAAAVFWRQPTPWMIAAALVAAVAARAALGNPTPADAAVVAGYLAVFPFVEWVIHVGVLHWRPRTVAGRRVDSLLARSHRAHHADPRDIPLIFIPWRTLVWVLPALALAAFLVFPSVELALTFLATVAVVGLGYEWTHYLIHSTYRPRGRLYKAVWRNHRNHHFKNEHYWFTVTTAGTADRVLGTYPDPAAVATSPTARNLHAARP